MVRMMVLMVEMMLMMILMMPGVMTVTISPSGRKFSRQNLSAMKVFLSLSRFHREEAAEKFYEVAP